jgi:hypothetical protein
MLLVHRETNIPVPEVLGYSPTLETSVSFPYIVMRCFKGQTASEIWFDQPYDCKKAYKTASHPSSRRRRSVRTSSAL